ncbi:MAG: CehA/McbA family metallohydrolase [Chloroflexota bacterium]
MIGASPYTAGGYVVLKLETHLHSLHSDGQHSVSAMFEACRSAGYEAVALTDHNTLSGLEEGAAAAERLGLVFVPGVEVTTFGGHGVVLGVTRVPEWRDLKERGMDSLADDVHAQGGLLCVSHPAALGSPMCSGCAWNWAVQPRSVDLWEVFSAPRPRSEIPAELWRQLLASGGHAAPVAAGDVHSTSAAARLKIATYVYARERSPAAVIAALRERRVFASNGPRLDLWLEDSSGNVAPVGSRVGPGDWVPRLSGQGNVREVEIATGERYVFAERRDADQRLEAISAPIWIESSH